MNARVGRQVSGGEEGEPAGDVGSPGTELEFAL